jgi:hypothetical protein
VVGRQDERHEGRHDRRRERVAEGSRKFVAAAVGARLWQRAAAGAEDHASRPHGACVGRGHEAALVAHERGDPRRVHEPHARARCLAHEGIEHRPRRVGRRKELAGLLALELDARLGEERHRVGHAEAAEHLADRRGRAAGVVGLAHHLVRDVTAAAPGHEDLRAELPCAVHGDDRERAARGRGGTAGPRGREQAGGSGADDENVGLAIHGGTHQRWWTSGRIASS